MGEHLQVNPVTFASGDGSTELQGFWHLPAHRATNGAVIVLHGNSYTKEAELNQWLCEGAAQLGLTALRFDFRYVQTKQAIKPDLATEVDDLRGAYNFLQSFGKEIKPKRLYLVGKSLGAIVAMKAAVAWANAVNGVVALGLPLHDAARQHWFDYTDLTTLDCSKLFVIGERDNLGDPHDLQPLYDRLREPKELAVIPRGGHSYEPIVRPEEPALGEATVLEQQRANQRRVSALVAEWLAREDANRVDLRK